MTLIDNIAAPPKRSKDFATAVYDDWKRKAIDSAKKRAVAQFVDYETFKRLFNLFPRRPWEIHNFSKTKYWAK